MSIIKVSKTKINAVLQDGNNQDYYAQASKLENASIKDILEENLLMTLEMPITSKDY